MTARQIILEGGSPWGFRMHGGADVQQPLRISRVNPGSKAAARGVREGDVITTINGESTRNKTNSEAHALLKSAGNTLKLGLNQDCIGGSPKKRQYNNSNDNNTTSTQQEVLTETIKRSNIITKFIISSSSTSTTSSATTTTTNLRTETPTTDNPATNRNEVSKENIEKNGFKLNGDSSIKPTPKDYYFSDRSTISSNYSSAASTPSTLTESQGRKYKEAKRIHRVLRRNRHKERSSLLHEIDSALSEAKGFLFGRGIWSPGSQKDPTSSPEGSLHVQRSLDQDTEPIPPVWAPKSAGSSPSLERKEFRSVNFGSPVLGRKNKEGFSENTSVDPPWRNPSGSSDISVALSSSLEKRIPNSYSAPGFSDFPNSRLPKAQNPTITLLQKARGGHLPKGAAYIEQDSNPHISRHDPSPPKLAPGEIVYEIKHEYTSESENERPKKMADLSQRKYPMGIGPTTKDGMPLTLRSEVKDQNQSKWYKRMYDTIHKQKPRYDDDYVTVRYKQRRGRYPYNSGYLSEPEPGAYDSDASIYDHRVTTLDRRRTQPAPANGAGGDDNYVISYTMPRSSTNSYIPQTSTIIKHGKEVYKNQPGRIENYVPGRSSISDKEAKEWWDEVMDIFDGWLADHSALPSCNYMLNRASVTRNNHLEQQKHTPHKGYMSQALKESGYESDSTLVFRRRDENINQLSPSEQREAYKTIQRGGDVPLHGLRKPAPERPKESPRKYVENEVTIHYRTPVRQEIKEALSEDELQRRQAEYMKKIYQEERRIKKQNITHSNH